MYGLCKVQEEEVDDCSLPPPPHRTIDADITDFLDSHITILSF